MTDYSELVRCMRDCWDESVGERDGDTTICDCDHCLFKDKIEVVPDDNGEEIYTDYTTCETAMVLAAADAIESLMDKLNRREETITVLLNGISDAKAAIADVLEKNIGGIISE